MRDSRQARHRQGWFPKPLLVINYSHDDRQKETEGEWATYLLQFEDMLVEVVLQSLIGKVDAELLKAVVLIVLKAKDIQYPNGQNLK